MKANHPTGLGEPEVGGKLNLFQPPKPQNREKMDETPKRGIDQQNKASQIKRIHTTLDLTWEALQVIEEIQRQHRRRTGKVLPQWKAVSQAIVGYAQMKKQNQTDLSEVNPA